MPMHFDTEHGLQFMAPWKTLEITFWYRIQGRIHVARMMSRNTSAPFAGSDPAARSKRVVLDHPSRFS